MCLSRYVFLLLLIPALAHAATLGDILSAGMIGVTIGFLLAGLGYMVAGFIGTPQAHGWAKNEVFENLYTLFIVFNIGILGVAALVFFAVLGIQSPQLSFDLNSLTSTPIMTADAATQIDHVLNGADAENAYKDLTDPNSNYILTDRMGVKSLFLRSYSLEVLLGELAYITQLHLDTVAAGSTTQGAGGGIGAINKVGISAPMFPGVTKVVDVLEQINELIILVIFILIAHKAVLIFIDAVGPQILLIGIFFRCIPFTRRLGSTLIALFITLEFVYPAFLLATFSDNFYGKIIKDFDGVYVNTQWITGLSNSAGTVIQYVGPRSIIVADNNTLKNGINLSFVGYPSEYNYTVKDGNGNVICKGSAITGEQVDCLIDVRKLTAADLIEDENKPELGLYEYNITLNFNASEADANNWNEIKDYPYTKTLSVILFVIKPCETNECNQKFVLRNAEYGEMLEAYIADQLDNPFGTYAPGVAADTIVLGTKYVAHTMMNKGLKTVEKSVLKQVAKTGTKNVLSKALSGAVGATTAGATFIISSALMKSDIATGTFDELACDGYTGYIAQRYVGGGPADEPKMDSSQLTFYNMTYGFFRDSTNFIGETLGEMRDDYVKRYGKSDFTSCSSSTGLFNWVVGKVGNIYEGVDTAPREFNVTVTMTRVVLVFIISLFSLIISVTFFRAISESIGGDSSLLGLGKII